MVVGKLSRRAPSSGVGFGVDRDPHLMEPLEALRSVCGIAALPANSVPQRICNLQSP